MEADLLAGAAGNAETKGKRLSGGGAAIAFGAGKFPHARVKEPGLIGTGLFTVARVGGRKVAISQAFLKDGVGDLAVQSQTFGLLVLLVPAQIEPAQPFEDRIDGGVLLRSTSVSSRRRTMVPPLRRA